MPRQINWWRIFGILLIISIIIGGVTWAIISQVTDHYEKSDPKLHQLRNHLTDLHPIIHDVSLSRGNKSYTINKKRVHLCLYDENNKYYNDNMLIYVLIHELAHCITNSIGHTEEFHENFNMLLKKAESMGLYDSSTPPIQNYCGHK